MIDKKSQAIDLISEVLSGAITDSREFSRRVWDLELKSEKDALAVALHQAGHFVADADIFAKDPAYQRAQTERLKQLLEELKTN